MNFSTLKKKNIVLLIDFVILCVIIALYLYKDWAFSQVPVCIFNKMTGLYCISCGGTRALMAAFRFDFLGAMRENVFLVFIGFVMFFGWISYNIGIVFNNKVGEIISQKLSSPKIIFVLILMACIFWVIRNIPCYPFVLLAPI